MNSLNWNFFFVCGGGGGKTFEISGGAGAPLHPPLPSAPDRDPPSKSNETDQKRQGDWVQREEKEEGTKKREERNGMSEQRRRKEKKSFLKRRRETNMYDNSLDGQTNS